MSPDRMTTDAQPPAMSASLAEEEIIEALGQVLKDEGSHIHRMPAEGDVMIVLHWLAKHPGMLYRWLRERGLLSLAEGDAEIASAMWVGPR